MPRWGSTVLYGRPPVASDMARAAKHRATVTLPADLTPRMRRAWAAVDPWVTDEQMDAVYEALKRFAVAMPPSKTDGSSASN